MNVTVNGDATIQLFSETQSRYVVSVKEENVERFEDSGLPAVKIGVVTEENNFVIVTKDGKQLINETTDNLVHCGRELSSNY